MDPREIKKYVKLVRKLCSPIYICMSTTDRQHSLKLCSSLRKHSENLTHKGINETIVDIWPYYYKQRTQGMRRQNNKTNIHLVPFLEIIPSQAL